MILFDTGTTVDDVVAIAQRRAASALGPEILPALSSAYHEAGRLAVRVPVYGRSTGFGSNKTARVSASDDDHGMRLLRSSAVDAGDPLPAQAVRAMLAVRLSQLCTPGAGLDPAILPALVAMLNTDALPEVLEYGSIGTGDLAALCGTALTLIGERPASRPLTPMAPWSAASALPFVSSNALTIGRAVLAADDLRTALDAALVVYALTFLNLRGNPSPFSAAAALQTATPAAPALAARIRMLVGTEVEPARIQDPYGLRAHLVSTAAFSSALDALQAHLGRLLHAAQENPLFVYGPDGAARSIEHTGNFLQAPLALALDSTAIALAQTIPLHVSRVRMSMEPGDTGLSPFLAVGEASASGVMMLEYVIASAYGTILSSAAPASTTTVVLSRGAEEDASFASESVVQLERAARAYRTVVASELVVATRLLRQRRDDPRAGGGVSAAAWEVVQGLDADDTDRDQRPDLQAAERLLAPLAELARVTPL